MPRPYRSQQRQANTEQTRTRIIEAARELLIAMPPFPGFSIEAVARQADVARMTVYYQFGSKIGLLESLLDILAHNGGIDKIPELLRESNPLQALDNYISIFGFYWNKDRLVTRRLRALAVLDPDFEHVLQTRMIRRRYGSHLVIHRLTEQLGYPDPQKSEENINILLGMTSFEVFDNLAGPSREIKDLIPLVQNLTYTALNLPGKR